jgi:CRISPR/Cas system-associated exonuclease Cas4 (RecB family)
MFDPDLKAEADISKALIAEIESRPPSGHNQRPRHSFSQLAHYLHCPIRYKFAVIYGLEVQWLDPVDFGANVHRCLEAIHRRALQGISTVEDDIPALIEETWLSTPRSKPDQEEAYKKAAVNQLRRYIQKYNLMLGQVVQAETLFSFSLDGHVIQAKVDLIRHNDERELEVVDFKTSGATPEEVDQAEIQLSLYALGLETVLKKPMTRQVAHFLGDGQVYTWDWTEERKAKTQDRLTDILRCIENQEFLPRLQYCPHCQEFKAICPYPRN